MFKKAAFCLHATGIIANDYDGGTLRENLGSPPPILDFNISCHVEESKALGSGYNRNINKALKTNNIHFTFLLYIEMKELMDHKGIAQTKQPVVRDVVTKGTYTTICENISHTQFFIKFIGPLVNVILSLDIVEFVKGCCTKLLAYSSICRKLEVGELILL